MNTINILNTLYIQYFSNEHPDSTHCLVKCIFTNVQYSNAAYTIHGIFWYSSL